MGFVSLHAKSFDNELKSYLHSKLSSFEKIEYSIVKMPGNFKRIEINSERDLKLVKNFAYVPVKVIDGNESVSSAVLTVKVKLYNQVLVAHQNIDANNNLENGMFSRKLEDVSLIKSNFIDVNEVKLYRSKVSIKEGMILSGDLVELIPIINKGDKVVVHTGKNGVDVSLEAITREDGLSGEVIRVQANNKIFKAKVIDKYNLMLVE